MNFFILSDFNIRSNNRGTAALGYGAIGFLLNHNYIKEDYEIIKYRFYRNPFHRHDRCITETLDINGKNWKYHIIQVWTVERLLYKYKLHFFNTLFKRTIKNVKIVAALNGGDGLTDIYGDILLESRLPEINMALDCNIPFVIMPQTIGPFLDNNKQQRIIGILRKAEKIYVRDKNFVAELENNGLSYTLEKDLSFFMKPIPFDIDIKKPCVGINVSGLAYSNQFGNLVGQFSSYPLLMTSLVKAFQDKGCNVYIIPHSYNVNRPERNNDDMEASKMFYESLDNKERVFFVDQELISPQVKYLISQMDFFIGARMHANFAAIFSGVPLFGLAYSYKFKGAFENNGIYNRTCDINNLAEVEVPNIVSKIVEAYHEDYELKQKNK